MLDVNEVININKRWEEGIPHVNRTIELYEFISKYDFTFCSDYFEFKAGGDGDTGEQLMYLIDEYFANKDKEIQIEKEK